MSTWKSLAVVALLLAGACVTKENTTTTAPPALPEFSKTYTLQGVVADAATGARLGGSDLRLYLIQGADVRSPARLNTDAADPLMGEFAFTGIPADYNTAAQPNKVYKVVAVKPGYQRFEADLTFVARTGAVLDTVYNRIGNIYLFPLGVTAPALQYQVRYNGKPVPNATVLLDPVVTQNDATFNPGDALAATNGLLASVSGTTDAAGQVTFAGSTLALGAAYQAQVLPVAFTDSAGTVVQLARFRAGTNVVVGLANTVQTVVLGDLTPTGAPLYVVSASNQPVGQLNAAGNLQIVFNAPVTLVNPAGFTAAFVGTTTGVFATPPVTATLSGDGLTLTLAPSLTTPIGAADRGLAIQYGDGTALVSPRDYPTLTARVFADLTFATGTAPSGLVEVRAP